MIVASEHSESLISRALIIPCRFPAIFTAWLLTEMSPIQNHDSSQQYEASCEAF